MHYCLWLKWGTECHCKRFVIRKAYVANNVKLQMGSNLLGKKSFHDLFEKTSTKTTYLKIYKLKSVMNEISKNIPCLQSPHKKCNWSETNYYITFAFKKIFVVFEKQVTQESLSTRTFRQEVSEIL